MKVFTKIFIIIVMLTLLLKVARCETTDDLKREWQNWRILTLELEDDIEWDGTTYEIAIPEDPDFWWMNLGMDDLFASSYACESSSAYYAVIDGVLFSADLTILYRYPPMKAGWYYLIPSTVECIEQGAFLDNYYLREVIVCDSVRTICSDAFNHTGIRRIHLPPSIIDFDVEAVSWMPCMEEMIVKEGSECWRELKFAEESGYMDYYERNIVKVY